MSSSPRVAAGDPAHGSLPAPLQAKFLGPWFPWQRDRGSARLEMVRAVKAAFGLQAQGWGEAPPNSPATATEGPSEAHEAQHHRAPASSVYPGSSHT